MITMESVSTEGLVTDNEISTVRDFLSGSKNIIETKMNSIKEAAESFVDTVSELQNWKNFPLENLNSLTSLYS